MTWPCRQLKPRTTLLRRIAAGWAGVAPALGRPAARTRPSPPRPAGSAPPQRDLSHRLIAGDPTAVLELYDETSASAYSLALQITRSADRACAALRAAFLRALDEPAIFDDPELSSSARVLLEVAHQAVRQQRAVRRNASPNRCGEPIRPGRSGECAAGSRDLL